MDQVLFFPGFPFQVRQDPVFLNITAGNRKAVKGKCRVIQVTFGSTAAEPAILVLQRQNEISNNIIRSGKIITRPAGGFNKMLKV
jgi:hypothetical protein